MDRDTFHGKVRDFLASLQEDDDARVAAARVGADDNLFDLGIVTSFSIIRMIVFVEELTGCSIDISEHDIERFYTLNGVYELAHAQEGAAR